MKITGKMLYQVYAKHAKQHSVDFWEWDEVNPDTQSFYEGIAEDLSTMLAEHQTQPLVAERKYHTRVEVFTSECNNPFPLVQNAANKWLSEHPEAVIISSHVNVVGSNPTEFTITLIVELPVSEERPDPYQNCRIAPA